MNIYVFGLKTKISIKKIDDSLNAVALYDPVKNLITLDPRSQTQFQDFSHELFHVFWYRTGMRQYIVDPTVEEIIAENFSILLTENLKDIIKVYEKLNKKKPRNTNRKRNRTKVP
jgi:hypothetical protein